MMLAEKTEGLRIRALTNIRGNGYISKPGTILREGMEYDGHSNPNGAISGICENGELLGCYPDEFEFITAPDWVLKIWGDQMSNAHRSVLEIQKDPQTKIINEELIG